MAGLEVVGDPVAALQGSHVGGGDDLQPAAEGRLDPLAPMAAAAAGGVLPHHQRPARLGECGARQSEAGEARAGTGEEGPPIDLHGKLS